MENQFNNPDFLARWIAGDLSVEELEDFKKTKDFEVYNSINKHSQEFKAPTIDLNAALISTKEKISFGRHKKKQQRYTFMSIAASVILLIGAAALFTSNVSYKTNGGEQLAINLPDGSKVQLNANSTLKHRRFFWKNNRKLNLSGEGYFEVEKGGDFQVQTGFGNVTVIGTKFNIKSRKSFDLKCFEGVVRYDNLKTNESKVLKQNDHIEVHSNIITHHKKYDNQPSWLKGISVFKSVKFSKVIEELQHQYGVHFIGKNIPNETIFSGSFTHRNLKEALQTTLSPLGIQYELKQDNKTIIIK